MGCAFVDLGLRVYRARGFRVPVCIEFRAFGFMECRFGGFGRGRMVDEDVVQGLGQSLQRPAEESPAP